MKKSLSITLICVAFVAGIIIGAGAYKMIDEIKEERYENRIEKELFEKNQNSKDADQNPDSNADNQKDKKPDPAKSKSSADENKAVNDQPSSKSNDSSANYIGEEKAKEIALNDIGFSADEVSYIYANLDYEDDYGLVPYYDVSFKKDRTEYEYEIDAVSGDIITFDKDFDD